MPQRITRDSPGGNSPPGPLPIRLETCETRTKKKTLHASERDRPDIQKKHRLFRRAVRRIEPERLVFLDETGITTMRTLTYAWAPRGERAVGSVPTSWVTVTVIAALGWDGVRAPLAFPGPPTQRRSSLMWIRRWCRRCARQLDCAQLMGKPS